MIAATSSSCKIDSKWRQLFVKNGFKNLGLCPEPQNFVHFEPYDLVQISSVCGPNTYQIMYTEILEFQSQHLQRYHRKVLMTNLLQKLVFRPGILCYHY